MFYRFMFYRWGFPIEGSIGAMTTKKKQKKIEPIETYNGFPIDGSCPAIAGPSFTNIQSLFFIGSCFKWDFQLKGLLGP